MAETTLFRYRLKPGRIERLREWVEEVNSRRDEAIETLQDESVFSEAAFLNSTEDEDYVMFYMEAEDLEMAHEVFESSQHDLDQEFKQLLGEIVAEDQPEEIIEPLYHLANPDRP
ncbi:DUF6176 family protein [Haladaptatus pallidirubidus]|uniref:ABM domain-containing protein n=1 Tax=Haladaptatus pallidirubidus TaxID=1008152 RepID=A0AAV3UNM9_9EURY|nr:DUF6176 family protein [Haladaptatus pallidirubidus]